MIYSTFRYPCIDKYPEGREFVTNDQLLRMARRRIQTGKLKTNIRAEFTKLRAAFIVKSIWKVPTLNITFMDGTDKQKNWVRSIIGQHLEPLMDKVKFNWNSGNNASDIRISFKLIGQAWSMVGSEARLVPKTEPTMNLGWLDDDVQYNNNILKNTGMVVLHEFGHAIGMIHEHQNPKDNPIKWNHDVVYAEMLRTNGWNREMTKHNMFKKYGDFLLCQQAKAEEDSFQRTLDIKNFCEGDLVNGSEYDVTSIMHYFYEPEWIKEGPTEIPVNTVYSPMDQKWIRKYYGSEETKKITVNVTSKDGNEAVEIEEPENNDIIDVDVDLEVAIDNKEEAEKNYTQFYIMTIVSIIILLVLLYLVYVYIQDKDDSVPPINTPTVFPNNRFYENM